MQTKKMMENETERAIKEYQKEVDKYLREKKRFEKRVDRRRKERNARAA